jgi:hypothetical protein
VLAASFSLPGKTLRIAGSWPPTGLALSVACVAWHLWWDSTRPGRLPEFRWPITHTPPQVRKLRDENRFQNTVEAGGEPFALSLSLANVEAYLTDDDRPRTDDGDDD